MGRASGFPVRGRCFSGSQEGGRNGLTPEPQNPVTGSLPPSLSLSAPLHPGPRQLTPPQGMSSKSGATGSLEGGDSCIPPGCCCMDRRASPKEDGICIVGEGLSTGTLVAVPFSSLPGATNPSLSSYNSTLLCQSPR